MFNSQSMYYSHNQSVYMNSSLVIHSDSFSCVWILAYTFITFSVNQREDMLSKHLPVGVEIKLKEKYLARSVVGNAFSEV